MGPTGEAGLGMIAEVVMEVDDLRPWRCSVPELEDGDDRSTVFMDCAGRGSVRTSVGGAPRSIGAVTDGREMMGEGRAAFTTGA